MSRSRTSGRSIWPRYGIDAPYVPAILTGVGVVGVVVGIVGDAPWLLVVGVIFLIQAAVFMFATLRGKLAVWSELFDRLQLRGDEELLDVGCGRGAVLVEASRRLPRGMAHGIDLWRSVDQSGNAEAVTRSNADAAGTIERVQLHTGDMTDMPFADASFDVVTSSLAIHNISSEHGRHAALDEIVRVLRPGGRVTIADLRHVTDYGHHLTGRGLVDVETRNLGPRFWFSGPWMSTSVVTATKPPEATDR